MTVTEEERAVWSTAYVNNLPDSAFLYVESGGSKDSEGKTTPRTLRHFPYKDANGSVDLPHLRNALARIPQSSLPASVKQSLTAKAQRILAQQNQSNSAPPRENLYRGIRDVGLSESVDENEGPVLFGHFARFDQPVEIDSAFEGHFMERIAPGAFSKTIQENRDSMRVLFQHGRDPQIGDKPLGPILELREDETGPYYEVSLLDTSYNQDISEMLRAGVLGASYRFRVIREDYDNNPGESDQNPKGLPERVIREAAVSEFGPVTFPADQGASAFVRSLTDEFVLSRLMEDEERLGEALDYIEQGAEPERLTPVSNDAPSEQEPASATPAQERREETETTRKGTEKVNVNIDDVVARQDEIKVRQREIYSQSGEGLSEEERQEFYALQEEYEKNEHIIKEEKKMRELIEDKADVSYEREERKPSLSGNWRRERIPENIYDFPAYATRARDLNELPELWREGARRINENLVPVDERANREDSQAHIERVLEHRDPKGEFASRVIATSSPLYKRAWSKKITYQPVTREEQEALERAMTIASTANYAVPISLDPTVILTSDGVVNPIRQVARVETITGNQWNGVTSAGVSAAYAAEQAEATDGAPTFGQPIAYVEKAHSLVEFSIEAGQDFPDIGGQMARMFADAKDILEGAQFLTGLGHGSHVPEGLLVGGTGVVATAAATTLAVGDLYSLEEAVYPRWRSRAVILANKKQFNRIRAFDTSGGSSLWVQLGDGLPRQLLGYPNYEYSNMSSAVTSGASIITMGAFDEFLIVDRVGMEVELINHFQTTAGQFGGNRALYAWWRNTSKVLTANAFKTIKVT